MWRAILLLLLPICAQAQENLAIGAWRSYASLATPVAAAAGEGIFYKLAEPGLAYYDMGLGQYAELTKTDDLSTSQASALYVDPTTGTIFIGHSDGRIDFFTTPGDVSTITDISRNQSISVKTIRAFTSAGNLLYIATDFGLVGYDIQLQETRFSTRQISTEGAEQAVSRVAIFGGRLYALLPDGLYSAPLTGANLSDPAAWRAETGLNGLPAGSQRELCATSGHIYLSVGDAVYRSFGGSWAVFVGANGTLRHLSATTDRFWLIQGSEVRLYNPDGSFSLVATTDPAFAAFDPSSGFFTVADRTDGLLVLEPTSTSFTEIYRRQSAVPLNSVKRVTAYGGQLLVAPTGYVGRFQPGFNGAGVFLINPSQRTTTILTDRNGGIEGDVFWDFGAVCFDRNSQVAYWGAWGQGILKTSLTEELDFFTPANSGISTIAGTDASYISTLALDPAGNLWSGCFDCSGPVNVLTPAGNWANFPVIGDRDVLDLTIGTTGYLYYTIAGEGLLVYNPGTDPLSASDDQQRYLSTFVGQGALPGSEVFSVAEDRTGALWLGTSNGVGVIFNPFDFFSGVVADAQKPILDGFALLRGQRVTAIAVDGANRKWLGTEEGVYVVSPDGDSVLARYTAATDPLPSDNIQQITIDPITGEVFFVTDAGLVGYRGAATEPALDNTEPMVFPNPVYSDYTGPITIRQVAEGTVVRITDVAGRLIKEIAAEGGQAFWDGRDQTGSRVVTGIYIAQLARADGKQGGIAKIAFIRRN